MGFYLRKSFNFGPFRLNLSKSGLGASVGVKGARVNINPKGVVGVHAGRGGLYYRKSLGRLGVGAAASPPALPQHSDPAALAFEARMQLIDRAVDESVARVKSDPNGPADIWSEAVARGRLAYDADPSLETWARNRIANTVGGPREPRELLDRALLVSGPQASTNGIVALRTALTLVLSRGESQPTDRDCFEGVVAAMLAPFGPRRAQVAPQIAAASQVIAPERSVSRANAAIILLALLVLAVVGVGVWLVATRSEQPAPPEQIAAAAPTAPAPSPAEQSHAAASDLASKWGASVQKRKPPSLRIESRVTETSAGTAIWAYSPGFGGPDMQQGRDKAACVEFISANRAALRDAGVVSVGYNGDRNHCWMPVGSTAMIAGAPTDLTAPSGARGRPTTRR